PNEDVVHLDVRRQGLAGLRQAGDGVGGGLTRGPRVGKGALAPCPPSLQVSLREGWARCALPTLRDCGSPHPSTNPPPRLTCDAVPPRILKIPAEPATLLPDRFQAWFAARGWSPREHQLALLDEAREDRSALLIAPTGAGKTLAGFLPTLVELSTQPVERD